MRGGDIYILLLGVAEKTLIKCAGLKDFITVGFTAGLRRQANARLSA